MQQTITTHNFGFVVSIKLADIGVFMEQIGSYESTFGLNLN